MSDDGVRDELTHIFVLEGYEELNILKGALHPDSGALPESEAVHEHYRVGHKLKGAAALYQFHGISALGDLIERVLEHARATPPVIWPQVVTLLRDLLATLTAQLDSLSRTGREQPFDAAAWQQRYQDILSTPVEPVAAELHSESREPEAGQAWSADLILPPIDDEILEYFVPEIMDLLASARVQVAELGNNLADADRVFQLFRAVHTMKGSSYTVGYQIIGDVALPLEDHLRQIRDRKEPLPSSLLALTVRTLEVIERLIARQPADIDALRGEISALLEALQAVPEPAAVPASAESETAAANPGAIQDAPAVKPQSTEVASGLVPTVPQQEPEDATPMPMVDLPNSYLIPELDADVLSYFIPEAQEHLEALETLLLKLEKDPQSADLVNHLFRSAHTLKGSAFTVGFTPIGDLVHHVEDLMGAIREGRMPFVAGMTDAILKSVDVVRLLMRRDAMLLPQVRSRFHTVVADLKRWLDQPLAMTAAAEAVSGDTGPHAEEAGRVVPSGEDPSGGQGTDVIRVNRERLEKLLNLVGELVAGRGRLEQRLLALEHLANQVQSFKGKMLETVRGFEEKHAFTLPSQETGPSVEMDIPGVQDFGALEFDKYDDFNILARRISEVAADVTESMSQLSLSIRSAREDMSQLHHLTLGMRDEIARARMVAIGTPFTRFRRAVREMARATHKEVTLITSGEQTEVDTNIVERLVDPLVHLVRNAVYHGIEPTGTRIAQCKPAVGTIYLHAAHRGNSIVIEIEDDGAGMDVERIKSKAVSRGIITKQVASTMSDSEAYKLIFLPGFSTAEFIDDQAGRGVGLDVVKKTIESMNGFIEIETAKGVGTKFTLNLPLTLLIATALMVRVGALRYAIPLSSVREVTLPSAGGLQHIAGQTILPMGDEAVPVHALDCALQGLDSGTLPGGAPVVIVRGARGMLGLAVDELLGRQEIVVKPLGALKILERSLFSGATIDPEGRVILVVDAARLGASDAGPAWNGQGADVADAREASGFKAAGDGREAKQEWVVLLVDDSLSIRKFVARMLEGAGYRVETAVDGEEGVRKASTHTYGMIITDLEMPKLNGYEVIQALRSRPQTHDVPIVVMTTRAGDKHKQLALNIGASGYIAKPVEERALIAEVEKWIGSPAASRRP